MLVLCQEEHGPPDGRRYEYIAGVAPLGYPETAILCTRGGDHWCDNPGIVYLNTDEFGEFEQGEWVFGAPGRGTKVKVTDDIVWRK